MQVADAGHVWVDPFRVATAIALRVLIVDLRHSVEGLVDVADVVDHEAQRERLLFVFILEPTLDLADVRGRFGDNVTPEPCSQVGERVDDIDVAHLEVGIVLQARAWLIQVRLIDKVPVALRAVALALDIVSESGAFGERVAVFV